MSRPMRNGSSEPDQTPYNQHQRPMAQTPSANYTLPGVISYLTSEFTNLERFKIITNLEKSEMKYKIALLQGEVEALKHDNKKHQLRIRSLEQENSLLRFHNNVPPPPPPEPEREPIQLPEVDVKAIEQSRHNLAQSIHDIMELLRQPTNLGSDLVQKAHAQHGTDLEALFKTPEDQRVNLKTSADNGPGPNPPAHKSAVARYFNDSSETDDFLNAMGTRQIPDLIIESDAETEIFGEDDCEAPVYPVTSTEPLKFNNGTISLSHEGKHLTISKGEKIYKHSISLPLATEDIVDVHEVMCEDNEAQILVVYGEGRVMQVCVKRGDQTEIALVESEKRVRHSCLVKCSPTLMYLVLEHHDAGNDSMKDVVVNSVSVHDSLLIVQSQITFTPKQMQGSLTGLQDLHLLSAEYHEQKAGQGQKNSNGKNRQKESIPLKIKLNARRNENDILMVFEAARNYSHIVKK